MRIAFFGTPHFAAVQLEHLINKGFEISVVITAPDKPAGRGRKLNQSAVKEIALKHRLTLLQPSNLKDAHFVESYCNLDIMSIRNFNRFLFIKLPSAFLCGVRLRSLNRERAVVTVTLNFLNKNPFKSMFWAVQGMAADRWTG